jgi:lipopolysaccharide biosynthesis regulator YciM
VHGRNSALARDYVKGINYLINEQPDKAIEVFLDLLRVDDETVETHFALASLFRRRGEVDRAIRIHQNLIARRNLEPAQHFMAQLELGIDYLRAGVFDRAEALFRELLDSGQYREQVLEYLIDIYQQEHDWNNAIDALLRLQGMNGRDYSDMLAHLLCEQAQERIANGNVSDAKVLLDRAAQLRSGNPRSHLIHARLAMAAGDFTRAIGYLRRIATDDSDFLQEAIEPLRECYRTLGTERDLITFLRELSGRSGMAAALPLADLYAEQGDLDAGIQALQTELRVAPSLRALEYLLDFRIRQAGPECSADFVLIRDVLRRLPGKHDRYRCRNCGFGGQTMHWQCPSCKAWSTVRPIRSLEIA